MTQGQLPASTAADPPGPIACAVVHFRLALLNSEIVYILHSHSYTAPEYTYPHIQDIEAWQTGLYDRLLAIRERFPLFQSDWKHLLSLCEIRYHEIVMLLFRPTPRIRTPSGNCLTICFQSAEATIKLWKELYNSDRMSYSWTSVHSISLSAIIILYCVWMVKDLTMSIEIDTLTQSMVSASNLLSAAGEYWVDARRCRNSLNNLTAATVRWLVNLRSSPQSRVSSSGGAVDSESCPGLSATIDMPSNSMGGPPQAPGIREEQETMYSPGIPWIDNYINEEDLASLFRTQNTFSADLSNTMEGMFSEFPPLFDFYQGNEFGL